MSPKEIQYLRQIGKHLRSEREARGLTLAAVAGSCGLAISELVRIENGELLGFKQVVKDVFSNAETYAKALDIELDKVGQQYSGTTTVKAKHDEVFIPVYLRKK